MSEFKPCPFCGAVFSIDSYLGRTVAIAQHEEWCFFPSFRPHQIQENDFDAWNTRAELTCKQNRLFNLVSRECDGEYYQWHNKEMPRYCPNCGAKVVDR